MTIISNKPHTKTIIIGCVAWAFFACATTSRAQLALVWDLDGTLFRRSKKCMASAIGQWDALKFYAKHGKKTESIIEHTLFDILNSANRNGENNATVGQPNPTCPPEEMPCDNSGNILPALMCNWFDGSKSSADLLSVAQEASGRYGNFIDRLHKDLMNKILAWMFRPDLFAECMKPAGEIVRLLAKCAEGDSPEAKSNKLYILSNMDADTFAALYKNKQNKSVFRYFEPDNIFISAQMGDYKPRQSIYREFLKRNNLKAEECILIDNQRENLDGARKCGMKTIYVNNGNYRSVRRELEKYGAF